MEWQRGREVGASDSQSGGSGFCSHSGNLLDLFSVVPSSNSRPRFSGGSRPSDKGGPGHPDPEIRGERSQKKNFFQPFGPQFGLKMRGAPPLDPPLHL